MSDDDTFVPPRGGRSGLTALFRFGVHAALSLFLLTFLAAAAAMTTTTFFPTGNVLCFFLHCYA
jgi:hypothetical protein